MVKISLKKAFNTVNHQVLLAKLEHYGVREEALGLLADYLQDSMWSMGGLSRKGAVEYGVLQGSVLGPLVFLMYVKDMVRVSRDLEFVLFADDINLFVEGRDPIELYGSVNVGLGKLDR